jgi:hypothetical protein
VPFPVKAIQKLFFSLVSRLASTCQREVQDHPDFRCLRKPPTIFFLGFFSDVVFIQENIGKSSLAIVAASGQSFGLLVERLTSRAVVSEFESRIFGPLS